MYIFVYVYISYTPLYDCIYIYTYIHIYIYILHACIYICMHTYICIQMYIYMYTHTLKGCSAHNTQERGDTRQLSNIHIYIYIYVYVYVYVSTHMYMYTYIYSLTYKCCTGKWSVIHDDSHTYITIYTNTHILHRKWTNDLHIYLHIYMYIHIYECIHTYTCIRIYTYKHTHTTRESGA